MLLVLLSLLLIFLLFLYLPIRIGAFGSYDGREVAFRGWVRPWAGLLGVGILYRGEGMRIALMVGMRMLWSFSLPGKKEKAEEPEEAEEAPADEEEEGEEEEEEALEKSLRERVDDALFLVERVRGYARRLAPAVGRFFKRLVRGFGFRRFSCRVVFGASDPATTGKVFGYALAVSNVLGRRAQVEVVPDFERARLEGETELEISVYIYRLLWAVLCLAARGALAWAVDLWNGWRRKRRAAVELRAAS